MGAKACAATAGRISPCLAQDMEHDLPVVLRAHQQLPRKFCTTAAWRSRRRRSRPIRPTVSVRPAARGFLVQPRAERDRADGRWSAGLCAGLWLGAEVFDAPSRGASPQGVPRHADPVALRAEARSRKVASAGPALLSALSGLTHADDADQLRPRQRRSSSIAAATTASGSTRPELESVLRWIKLGGERVSAERKQQEERARALAASSFRVEPKAPDGRRSLGPSRTATKTQASTRSPGHELYSTWTDPPALTSGGFTMTAPRLARGDRRRPASRLPLPSPPRRRRTRPRRTSRRSPRRRTTRRRSQVPTRFGKA